MNKREIVYAHIEGCDVIEYDTTQWVLEAANDNGVTAVRIGPVGLIKLGWSLITLGHRLMAAQGVSHEE